MKGTNNVYWGKPPESLNQQNVELDDVCLEEFAKCDKEKELCGVIWARCNLAENWVKRRAEVCELAFEKCERTEDECFAERDTCLLAFQDYDF